MINIVTNESVKVGPCTLLILFVDIVVGQRNADNFSIPTSIQCCSGALCLLRWPRYPLHCSCWAWEVRWRRFLRRCRWESGGNLVHNLLVSCAPRNLKNILARIRMHLLTAFSSMHLLVGLFAFWCILCAIFELTVAFHDVSILGLQEQFRQEFDFTAEVQRVWLLLGVLWNSVGKK